MNRLSMALAVALFAFGWSSLHAQDAATVEKLFASARHQETTQGDLRAAIETYRKVVTQAGSNRSLAAQALLRIGECHTKLGDAQARQAYEQVVRDFGDLPEAKTARARIGAAGTPTVTAAKTDRIVKAGENVTWGDGRVSPDGRYVSWIHYNGGGNLMLHDLTTGTDRNLTGNKDWSVGSAYASTFSPDGRQLAYGWRTFNRSSEVHVNEIRVMVLGSTGTPESRRLYGNDEVSYFNPVDWSADGRFLAVLTTRHDQSGQIAIADVRDGSFKVLKTTGWRGPDKLFFSPDGKFLAYDLPHSDDELERDVFVLAVDGSTEHRVVQHPSNDKVMGWTPDGSALLFASNRTGEFGLWTVPVSGGRTAGAPRLLKPDVGAVTTIGLTAAGVLHVVKDASTDGLHIAPVDLATGRLTAEPVLENFRTQRADWTPDGRYLAYGTTAASGVVAMNVRAVDSGQLQQFTVPLQYMNDPRWLPDGSAVVVYGRDFKGRGGIYRVDARTGAHALVALADLCRAEVSRDGAKIYYAVGRVTLGPGTPTRWVEHDLASGATRTVPRQGGVGSRNLSPDGHSFASIEVDRGSRSSAVVISPATGDGEARRVALPWEAEQFQAHAWTPDGRAVIVQASAPQRALWLVPIDGSAPRKLEIDISTWNLGWRLHPKGTHIAFRTGKDAREVWALESLTQR
jgi:Tol biopolymer transport system component